MRDKLLFATSNKNKLLEVRKKIDHDFDIEDLTSIGCTEEIPETQDTIEGNAIEKASYVYKRYGINCFAEDTGLEIEALNGEPGVFSARYAGEHKSGDDNIDLVLAKLKGIKNRKARFRTVLAFIEAGTVTTFEGIINGTITMERKGMEGFGYDPVFKPEGFDRTFAELPMDIKNSISHRARALQKFIDYITTKKG